jgi:hypothetical protein
MQNLLLTHYEKILLLTTTTFRGDYQALQNMADAIQLVAEAPRPDAPGRRYYSNLGFFLQGFTAPDGASSHELGLYIDFIQKPGVVELLIPGAKEKIVVALQTAIRARR